VREYQEAATALPRSLSPMTPSDGLKGRVLAAVTGRQAPRRAILSRVFWAAAAVVLFALVINSLGDHRVKLRFAGTPAAPKAEGTARYDEERKVTLEVSGLPALPPGKVYQLWHIGPKPTPIACTTFTLGASGLLEGEDTMRDAIAQGHKFALSIEPIGGSSSPTTVVAITQ
jgi:anti-sigma-K factor RskA